jgi:leucyl-tRNA synthetase
MFMGPFDGSQPWDPKGILGIDRFLARAWKYVTSRVEPGAAAAPAASLPLLHKTIKKVGEDIEQFKFNTAISALMVLLNNLEAALPTTEKDLESFVKLLHPFVPHLAQELWSVMGNATYLDFEPWPVYDPALIKDETITLIVQVNGKVRDTVTADAGITADAAQALALGTKKVQTILNGQTPKKVIYVDKKLVNIVL